MKGILQLPVIKPGIIFLLAAILILGAIFSGPSVSSQTSSPIPSGPTLHGQVESISTDNNSFTIRSDNQDSMTVTVDQNTTYLKVTIPEAALSAMMNMLETMVGKGPFFSSGGMPGMPGMPGMFGGSGISAQLATFADLAPGDIVTIKTTTANLASEILMVKLPDIRRAVGTVTSVTPDSITITPSNGDAVTLNWDEETRFILKGQTAIETDQEAMVIYRTASMEAILVFTGITEATASPESSPASSPEPPTTPQSISVDESNSGEQVAISASDKLEITLESNSSTGFSWQLIHISDTSVLQQESHRYEQAPSPMPGAPGVEVWTFRALQAGTSALLMEYSQPWEGGIKGARTFSLTVNVE